MRNERLYC